MGSKRKKKFTKLSCFFTTKKKKFFSFLLPFIVVVVVQWFKLKFDFFFSFSFWKVTTKMINNFSLVVGLLLRPERKKNHITSKLSSLCHSVCMPVYQCEKDHCHNLLFINMMIMDYQWIRRKKSCWWGNEFFSFFLPQNYYYYYYYQKVKVDQRKLKLKLKQWSFTICRKKMDN